MDYNKPLSKIPVNCYVIFCDFHGMPASRKGGLEVQIKGQHRFVCAPCCRMIGALRYEDIFGHRNRAPVDWIFSGLFLTAEEISAS